ncbi:hypothetical protein V3C99_017705, partial [Haemonchus contortus]|uniref:CUB domain-containing protein n=1 Tax=Haemonchus contortus TaxID=6289 RepID=A0A7I4Z4S1_HAECO
MRVLQILTFVILSFDCDGRRARIRPIVPALPRPSPTSIQPPRPPPVLEGSVLVREPFFPRNIPQAPGGQPDCIECPFISATRCRRGQTDCVEPVITYNQRGCSGSATVNCAAAGREITLAIKGGRNWTQLQSAPVIREQVYCRNGKWYINNGIPFNKIKCTGTPVSTSSTTNPTIESTSTSTAPTSKTPTTEYTFTSTTLSSTSESTSTSTRWTSVPESSPTTTAPTSTPTTESTTSTSTTESTTSTSTTETSTTSTTPTTSTTESSSTS